MTEPFDDAPFLPNHDTVSCYRVYQLQSVDAPSPACLECVAGMKFTINMNLQNSVKLMR